MRRYPYKKYALLGGMILLLFTLPLSVVERGRSMVVSLLTWLGRVPISLAQQEGSIQERLESENHFLRAEVHKLYALLEQQRQQETLGEELRGDLPLRRSADLYLLSSLYRQAIPAQVIYRDPTHWSSALWVNVGSEMNVSLGTPVIQKNSPVIVGRALIGVVDVVGKKRSRVRLITDASLTPAVRVARGRPQNLTLLDHIDVVLRHINGRTDIDLSLVERGELKKRLEACKQTLEKQREEWYLAKGILKGGSRPLWRSRNQSLRGIGFNYDCADAEGPARDLLTGKALAATGIAALPILKEHDLLVTSGLDGIFPPGLRVAEVRKIYPLREGAYTYEIEASPVAENLDQLHTVFIIPALGYDPEDI